MDWKDKVVFLTGASSGIGEALAVALAKKGATLGLLARREDLLREIAKSCEAKGGLARVFACDVIDEAGVADAAQALRDEFGRIDILICNAGIGGPRHARDLTTTDVKKVFEVNFMGAVNAVTATLPAMIKHGSGQLVAISSLAGIRGLPRSASYSASKGALTNFFESLRLDLIGSGVSVTVIEPGFILTPLTANRKHKLPFLMQLDNAIPLFIRAIERRKRFAAFPWQLASVVRLGRFFPGWLYDRIAGGANYREDSD
ncbi:MAG: SDR family NAD(P)-dependent oxidoreductase [Acidobacteria bacterium]|nr:SDR family NAD(P)-dependent oxidoreductase [Acidobacteriota bacterium]MBK8811350.1 SDR family NAD(P)-dependent oxidoreductase [Acidobacteriota bacterium]